MGQLQRLDPAADPETYQRLNRELMMLEMERGPCAQSLRQGRSGPTGGGSHRPLDFVSAAGILLG